jgi:hypothetical protein
MNKVRVRTFTPANHQVDEVVFVLSPLVFDDLRRTSDKIYRLSGLIRS